MQSVTWCGSDVSKATVEVYLPEPRRTIQIPNTPAGYRTLLRRLPPGSGVALEATASYHQALVDRLSAAGIPVRLIPPHRARRFVQARGRGDKTDRTDAQALAHFAATVPGPIYQPPSAAQQHLRAVEVRRRQVVDARRRGQNQREHTRDHWARQSVRRQLRSLTAELARIDHELAAILRTDAALAQAAQLLQTIPGVGPRVAYTLLADVPALPTFRDTGQLAAYVGVAPVLHHSGTSVHRSALPAGGKPQVRHTLYLPALAATRYNPQVRALYQRLLRKGKPPKVALAAAMHKLLRQCYGVLKHQQPYSPQLA